VPQLRVALAQVNPTVGGLADNIAIVEQAVKAAARQGAHLVALPEMVVTGYPVEDLVLRSAFVEASRTATNELAGRLEAEGLGGVAVILGYLDRDMSAPDRLGRPKGSPQTAAAVISGGRVVARSTTCRTTACSTSTATSSLGTTRSSFGCTASTWPSRSARTSGRTGRVLPPERPAPGSCS
jgi:predicted amidohydrolase